MDHIIGQTGRCFRQAFVAAEVVAPEQSLGPAGVREVRAVYLVSFARVARVDVESGKLLKGLNEREDKGYSDVVSKHRNYGMEEWGELLSECG